MVSKIGARKREKWRQKPSIPRSGPDLALLLSAFEEALRGYGFADHAARCALALEGIEPRSLLLMDLHLRTRLERKVIEALKAASPDWLELTPTGQASSRLDYFAESIRCTSATRSFSFPLTLAVDD
jgi:hypothetical protein